MEEKRTDPSSWEQKTLNRVILPSNPELVTASGVGKKAMQILYGYDELINHISNRIKQFNFLKERESSFFGRLQNKITGADTNTIELDGIVVQQLTALAGEELPIEIKLGSSYKIKHTAVKSLFEKAKNDPVQAEYDRVKNQDWRNE